MIEGGTSKTHSKIKAFIKNKREQANDIIKIVTEISIEYLKKQIESGANYVQIFESWAGLLEREEYIEFIIKPNGGTIAIGLGKFNIDKCINDKSILKKYFDENNQMFKEYIVQETIDGFMEYGEIKTYWIDGKFSYAVNTPGATSPDQQYKVNFFVNEIESDIAGTYTNFPNIKYPMVDVMADTYVKKTRELYPKKG